MTCAALHLWTRAVGKYRLCHTPWLNHSWHATLYVTPRGLTTGPVPDGRRSICIDFDFYNEVLDVHAAGGRTGQVKLEPMSVADFWSRLKGAITEVGGQATMHGTPNEIPHPVPFVQDTAPGPTTPRRFVAFTRPWCASSGCFRISEPASSARSARHTCSGVPSTPRSRASLGDGAASSGWDSQPTRHRHPGGVQPRGVLDRVLAGRQRCRRGDVLLLRLPQPQRLFRGAGAARSGLLP